MSDQNDEGFGVIVWMFGIFLSLLLGLWMSTDGMPDPVPASCSCAGKADCHVRRFSVEEGNEAICAMWDGGNDCCLRVSR